MVEHPDAAVDRRDRRAKLVGDDPEEHLPLMLGIAQRRVEASPLERGGVYRWLLLDASGAALGQRTFMIALEEEVAERDRRAGVLSTQIASVIVRDVLLLLLHDELGFVDESFAAAARLTSSDEGRAALEACVGHLERDDTRRCVQALLAHSRP